MSFVPTARFSYNNETINDTITIQEPFVCGDGLITRTEVCDTQADLGILYAGQTCENQQGQCVLVTHNITNNACINYQYTNNLGVLTTGQSCSSATLPLTAASCAIMTGTAPQTTNDGYEIEYTCRGNSFASATTPITIDCGNGTNIS